MKPSEVLRRVQQMHRGEAWPAMTLGDYAIATESRGSGLVMEAYAFLKEADWVLDRAIALAEAEES